MTDDLIYKVSAHYVQLETYFLAPIKSCGMPGKMKIGNKEAVNRQGFPKGDPGSNPRKHNEVLKLVNVTSDLLMELKKHIQLHQISVRVN